LTRSRIESKFSVFFLLLTSAHLDKEDFSIAMQEFDAWLLVDEEEALLKLFNRCPLSPFAFY
jgi:hypothetical protein